MPHPSEELRTDRLSLHKHRIEEADEQYAVIDQDRDRLAPWMPWLEKTNCAADIRVNMETCLEGWELGSTYDFTIKSLDGGDFLGRIGMHRIDKSVPRGEFGYWLRDSAERNGYIVEALAALEKEFFHLGFERFEIRCDPLNERSFGVAKARGYKLEGTLLNNMRIAGKLRDTQVWAKLRSDRSIT